MKEIDNAATDYVVENSNLKKSAPAVKGTSRSRGVGHNSGQASSDERVDETSSPPNVSAETFEVTKKADEEMVTFDHAMTDLSKGVLAPTYKAMNAVFSAVWYIFQARAEQSFYAARQISAHGNARNIYQALVAYFFRNLERDYVRQTVWRWSSVIALAMIKGIEPKEFHDWVTQWGVEALCEQYKHFKLTGGDAEASPDTEDALARSIFADDSIAPLIPASAITRDCIPLRLAVVELDAGGAGDYRLRVILPHSSNQIIKISAATARKRQEAGR